MWQAAHAQRLYDAGEPIVQQIADLLGVPRSTVYGHLDRSARAATSTAKSTTTNAKADAGGRASSLTSATGATCRS